MSGTKQDGATLVIGGEPRIDFLPLEIKERKKNRRSRRSLIFLVIAVVGACIVGYVFTAGLAVQAQVQLDTERARTQFLLKEQAKYSEARTVATDIDNSKAAALVGSSTEIMWKNYLRELKNVMPSNTTIVSFGIDSQNTLELAPVVTAPLEQPRVATLTFTARTNSLARADQLTVNVKQLPGFADATTTTIAAEDDSSYMVNVIVHINDSVFERRFFENPVTEDDADATAADTTPTEG